MAREAQVANGIAKKKALAKRSKVPPVKVVRVIDKIRGRVGKFHQKLVPPQIAMFEMISSFWTAQALSVAAQLGVADVMKDSEMHFGDIAKKVGAHPESLYRLMRGLTNANIFVELPERKFKLTAYGRCLRSDLDESVRSMAIFQGQYQWAHWAEMLHSVKTGETVVEKVRGQDLFGFLGKTPEAQHHFDAFMTTVSNMEIAAILSAYDFAGSKVIADIGGGRGSFLSAILDSQVKFKGVLYDQPQVVATAESELASGHLKSRCEIIGGSFFESVPKGADTYVMKHIIHDWEESKCIQILENIRTVIPRYGKLVLVESVVAAPNVPHFSKMLDLEMLVNAGGIERTAAQYAELLAKCQFKLVRAVETVSMASVLEAVPV